MSQLRRGARQALEYIDWLKGQLTADTPQRREFDRLVALARQGDLTLLCWCAPQSCHGDVVAKLIRAELERGNP